MTTSAPATSVCVLGGFAVRAGPAAVPVRPSGERLLAYLAVRRRPIRRGDACAALWGETPDVQAAASLRSVLWRLPRPHGRALVTCAGPYVALASGTEVDLWQADTLLAEPDEGAAGTAGLHDDVLPDWFDEWVLVERERHRQRRLHALERRSAALLAQGRYDDALVAALDAVAGEPLRESAHRRVIEVHLAEGNAAEALRQYDTYRRLARRDLGLSPSTALRQLVSPLLGRPADAQGDPE